MPSLRAKLYKERPPYCHRCGMKAQMPQALTVDHIMPKWMGGTSARENLQLICKRCHKAKNIIEARVRLELGKAIDPLFGLRGLERQEALLSQRSTNREAWNIRQGVKLLQQYALAR